MPDTPPLPRTGYSIAGVAKWTAFDREAWESLVAEQTQRTFAELQKRTEDILAEAIQAGRDVAFSDLEFDQVGAVTMTYVTLEPGEKPPKGRRWTLYSAHAGLCAAALLDMMHEKAGNPPT